MRLLGYCEAHGAGSTGLYSVKIRRVGLVRQIMNHPWVARAAAILKMNIQILRSGDDLLPSDIVERYPVFASIIFGRLLWITWQLDRVIGVGWSRLADPVRESTYLGIYTLLVSKDARIHQDR